MKEMKLGSKLANIFEFYLSLPDEEALTDSTGNVIISPLDRNNAKRRFLSYRCRRYIWDRVPQKPDDDNIELTSSEQSQLDILVNNLTNDFNDIETLYMEIMDRTVEGRIDLNEVLTCIQSFPPYYKDYSLGMLNPFENRNLFIWDILWSIISIYPTRNFFSDPDKSLLFENIERRLRKIERMRYNVSKHSIDRELTIDEDGHLLRMFEYPNRYRPPNVGGRELIDDYWTESQERFDFVLNENGRNYPMNAIEAIFQPRDTSSGWRRLSDRSHNICDRVIHILHLDELVVHLKRTVEDANETLKRELAEGTCFKINEQSLERLRTEGVPDEVLNNLMGLENQEVTGEEEFLNILRDTIGEEETVLYKSLILKHAILVIPIAIVASFTTPEAIGSGTPLRDKYFEAKSVRLDEIVPGDHLQIRNHPAYHGVDKGLWRLENVIVTRLLGTSVPGDCVVQGHGLGPDDFGSMQGRLLRLFLKKIAEAQQKVDLIWDIDNPPDLMDPTQVQEGLRHAFETDAPFGQQEKTMLQTAVELHANGLPFKYDMRYSVLNHKEFSGVIEFRNEYALREKGAFWLRWVSYKPNTVPTPVGLLEIDANNILWEMSEFWYDAPVKNLSYELPYVESIVVEQRLVTLVGFNLGKVTSVYFVTNPRRGYRAPNLNADPDQIAYLRNYINPELPFETAYFGTPPLISSFGTDLEIQGQTENELIISVPDSWSQGTNYWRPVLRTSIGVELRVEDSIFWSTDNDQRSVDVEAAKYHVAYFPLFERSSFGNYDERVTLDLTDTTGLVGTADSQEATIGPGIYPLLGEFFRENRPGDRIDVIRPSLEDLVGDA